MIQGIVFTLFYAIFFVYCQGVEYINSPVELSDSVYGSIFYLLTGFHGFHVIMGAVLIVISLIRIFLKQITITRSSVGFLCAVWYWHFVDIVWIFLFPLLYLLGRHFLHGGGH